MTTSTVSAESSTVFQWRFHYWNELLLLTLLVVGLLAAAAVAPRFVLPSVQLQLAGDAWPMALMALPMTLIIISGGIDLSIGAMVALCSITLGLALESELAVWQAMLAAIAVGLAAGATNGLLITWLRVHPLIVTLGTMAVFRGVALAVTRGRTIQDLPASFRELAGGVHLPLGLFILGIVLTAVFLNRTAYGRFLYAMGSNAQASEYSGVPVARIKVAIYTASGFMAAIAAIFLTSRYGQAKADFTPALEFEVITAVVLGGVSIFGGQGNIVGVFLGLLLIHECQKFVSWQWHVSELNTFIVGTLLVGSVIANSLLMKKDSS